MTFDFNEILGPCSLGCNNVESISIKVSRNRADFFLSDRETTYSKDKIFVQLTRTYRVETEPDFSSEIRMENTKR